MLRELNTYLLGTVSYNTLVAVDMQQDGYIRQAAPAIVVTTLPAGRKWSWRKLESGGYLYTSDRGEVYTWREGVLQRLM